MMLISSKSFRKNKKWNRNSMVKTFRRDFLFHMYIENLWFLIILSLFPNLSRYLMNETIMPRRDSIQSISYWTNMKNEMYNRMLSMKNLWKIISISEEYSIRNINRSILLITRLIDQQEHNSYLGKKSKWHGSN